MALLTPRILDAAFLAYDTNYQSVYETTPTFWQEYATQLPSMTEEEVHAFIQTIPQMRQWVGERVVNNVVAEAQAIKNLTFELTVGVPRAKFEDDRYHIYQPAIGQLAEAAKKWPDIQVTAALQAGGTTVGFDGQPYFDTEHPIDTTGAVSGSQSNLFTGTELTAENFASVRATMMGYKAADGTPLAVMPNILMVPPALERTAKTIVNASMIPSDAGTASQSNVMVGMAKVIVNPYLAGADTTWYLMDTTRSIKPFIWQLRQAPEFTFLNKPDDANVFLRDEFLFGTRARGAAGLGIYFLAAQCSA